MEEREPGFFVSLERRMQKAAAVFGLRPGQLVLAILVGVIAVLVLIGHAATGSGGSVPSYEVNVTGSLPRIQTVGQAVKVTVNVQNLRASTPDLIVDMGGCTDHWVLDGVTLAGAEATLSTGSYYDFGNLPAYGTDHIALQLVPSDAGNHVCQFKVWNGPLSSGVPQGDELETVSSTVAINP